MKTKSREVVLSMRMLFAVLFAACALALFACSGRAGEPFGGEESPTAARGEPEEQTNDASVADEEDDVDASTDTVERRECPQFVLCIRGSHWNKHACRCVRTRVPADAAPPREAAADAGCH
jgi:hypothetical protein